ncbi:AMP-binding protein, partial [Kocuria sp. UBA1838]
MFANTEPLTPLRFLERSAEVFPDRPAIVHGSRVWSYEQFERDVRRFATALLPLLSGSDGSAGAASRGSAGSDDAAGSPESAGSRESAGSPVTGGLPGTAESGDTAGSERSAGASGEGNESFQGAELLECSWPTVAVIAPNLPATLMAHYAVPAAGAVLVPLNPRLSARELSYILEHCEARVVLADTSVLETVAQALGDGSDVTLVQIDDPQA